MEEGGVEGFYLVQPADTRVPPRLDLLLQPRPQPQPAWLLHAAVWAWAQTHLQLHGSLRRLTQTSQCGSGGIISGVRTPFLLGPPIRDEHGDNVRSSFTGKIHFGRRKVVVLHLAAPWKLCQQNPLCFCRVFTSFKMFSFFEAVRLKSLVNIEI